MSHRIIRIAIRILAGFIALTAMGGGAAMLAGVDQFPLEWLRDTPFTTYTLPALLLILVVGGSSLLAVVLVFRKQRVSAFAPIAAGLIMMGFIAVEVVILKQTPPGPTVIEVFYFILGALNLLLGGYLWLTDYRSSTPKAHAL